MTSLYQAWATDESFQYFDGSKLGEAKQWIHKQFVAKSLESEVQDENDYFIEQCIVGQNARKHVYRYELADFLSSDVTHSMIFVDQLIDEGLVDNDRRIEIALFLMKEDLKIVNCDRSYLNPV